MQTLEKSVMTLAKHEMNSKVRARAVDLLQSVVSDLNTAAKIWSDFAKSASDSDASEAGAFGGWAGSSIEKDLYDLHLASRANLLEVSGGATSLDDPLVELAYNKLLPGQSSKAAAEAASSVIKSRVGVIQKLIKAIQNTKPVKLKGAAGKTKSKASGAKKKVTVKKGTGKKAAKKTAGKKKSTKKQPAAKKTVKKKVSAKKKPAPKKSATKKQAARKKPPTKKKAANKTTAKKK